MEAYMKHLYFGWVNIELESKKSYEFELLAKYPSPDTWKVRELPVGL
jgi:hypothetical protein